MSLSPGTSPSGQPPAAGEVLTTTVPPVVAPSRRWIRDRLEAAALRGGLLTVVGYGGVQVLRLLSNLLLTRLLFPEAFGLMALVHSTMAALQMFSDLGFHTCIIQDKEGDSPCFLDTAWTFSVLRGVVLWLIACALSWPLSWLYEAPALRQLIPVVGLSAVIMGFQSTRVFSHQRHLVLGRLTAIDLGVQLGALGLMCAVAWWQRTVWALVVGGLFHATLRVILSHTVLPGERNRFLWDREAARRLVRFGRWILISTMLTWAVDKSDRLILGASMAIATLGVYNIAALLAQSVQDGMLTLSSKVLFPLYARLAEVDAGGLRARIQRVRVALLLLALPPLCLLVAFSEQVLELLYDDRYHQGAWMLRALAAGSIVGCVGLTGAPVLLARGDSFSHMMVLAWRAVTLVGGVAWAHARWGVDGQVWAVALNPLLGYPALAWATRAHGVWMPRLDALAIAASALGVALLWLLRVTWLGH